MSFEVTISDEAQSDINGRPSSVQEAICTTLREDLAERPGEVGVSLAGPPAGLRSLQRGSQASSYRIVYQVLQQEVRVLHVYGPGH